MLIADVCSGQQSDGRQIIIIIMIIETSIY